MKPKNCIEPPRRQERQDYCKRSPIDKVDIVDKHLFPVRSAGHPRLLPAVLRACCPQRDMTPQTEHPISPVSRQSRSGFQPLSDMTPQTTKLHAESVTHTSLGLRPWRNPRKAPTRNSTLKACHIADTKDDFHCKATKNGQLSIGDRLPMKPKNCIEPPRRQERQDYFTFFPGVLGG
jgi:hypothetical protein